MHPRPCGPAHNVLGLSCADNGEPDAIAVEAEQHSLEDLPVEVLIFLLGSRYCETDRLSVYAAAQ